ncbi:hypothetical protein HNQ77_003548 [Silvibacterium bohemicum]|uniref:Uncharacterized protein n=1 Tax=Silvibacterium bohemicum TaxID=1577686 RepID=A0A841JYV7_9BACT|nr:hypothetical protein [Silvibacterium bohemicum]MBB6145587.1 hypothetical protein [Silvibacterium bohemicum]
MMLANEQCALRCKIIRAKACLAVFEWAIVGIVDGERARLYDTGQKKWLVAAIPVTRSAPNLHADEPPPHNGVV